MRWVSFSGSYASAVIEKKKRKKCEDEAHKPEPFEPATSALCKSRRRLDARQGAHADGKKASSSFHGKDASAFPSSPRDKKKPLRWIGKPTCLGIRGERFYQGVAIAEEHFHIGDDVSLATSGTDDDIYVGRIISFWETASGEAEMELKWYYAPEHTACGRLVGHDPREIFESVHTDDNPVAAIDGHVRVLGWDEYQKWLDEPVGDRDDDEEEDMYVCRAQYHPGTGEFMPLNGACSLSEAVLHAGPATCSSIIHRNGTQRPIQNPLPSTRRTSGRQLSRFSEAARLLTPHSAPTRLPCREKEKEEVTSALRASIASGGQGTSLYISGTPGTGKTATVHHALRILAHEEGLPAFRTLEVNGMKLSSPQQVYSLLWEGLTGQHVSIQRALALLEKRFATSDRRRKGVQEVVVLLLDELDYLVTRTQSVIYNLFEWASESHASLIVIGISNTMDLPERLLPRVHSRFGIRRINFMPYSHSEIAAIIADRLEGLEAFEPKGVELCARKIAAVSGDVRRALEVCRLAAQLAEREEIDRALVNGKNSENYDAGKAASLISTSTPCFVDLQHIDKASRQLRGSVMLRSIGTLPKQQLLLLCCIVLQQQKTGLAEVAVERLVGHHAALCRREGSPLPASPAELHHMLGRLKDGRLLADSHTPGTVRLLVQPEDIRHAAMQQAGSFKELPWGT